MSPAKPTAAHEAAAVRAYIAALPPKTRRAVKALRTLIRAAASGCADGFSYRIPAVRLDGRLIVWYAAWSEHTSIYPITAAMQSAAGAKLAKFKISKGTLRFPLSAPLPTAFITRLVKARVAEARGTARRGRAL
jgi:uncharacterized protein YdhG (YjbR/CyaY superfamily)